MYKVESVWGHPTNPFYNPRKARNGGGYWQYSGGALFLERERALVLEVSDTSCGEYGTRREVRATVGGRTFGLYWGSMDDFWHTNPTCQELRPLCAAARINISTARDLIRTAFHAANMAAWKTAKKESTR